jgi:hypothetical protein
VGDLQTKGRKLSVFVIEENGHNIDRIVAALAAGKSSVQHVHYFIFDSTLLDEAGIEIEQSDGITKDRHVNVHWHWDLLNLTGLKLVEFTRLLWNHGKMELVADKRVLELLRIAVDEEHIDRAQLDKNIVNKLHPAS